MAPPLTIHVGPFKTGSSSVQRALRRLRKELAGHGVLYPLLGPKDESQTGAVFDFVAAYRGGDFADRAWTRYLVGHHSSRYQGQWPRLVRSVKAHNGGAILSDEHLSDLSVSQAADFLTAFAGFEPRVVVVRRRMSRMLPSDWQEQSKRLPWPEFEAYVRHFAGLLLEPTKSEATCLDADRVAETWRAAGASVDVIDVVIDISDATVAEVLAALTPAGMPMWAAPDAARSSPSNPGLSADRIDIWRTHLEVANPHFVGAAMSTLGWLRRVDLGGAGSPAGGRYELSPAFGRALDHWATSAARAGDRAEDARASVEAQLADATPVTHRTPSQIGLAPGELQRVGRDLRNHQRRADARWTAYDQAARAIGRPRPVPMDSYRRPAEGGASPALR